MMKTFSDAFGGGSRESSTCAPLSAQICEYLVKFRVCPNFYICDKFNNQRR